LIHHSSEIGATRLIDPLPAIDSVPRGKRYLSASLEAATGRLTSLGKAAWNPSL
jgi:hypothetical protein